MHNKYALFIQTRAHAAGVFVYNQFFPLVELALKELST
jgi:hypothetical protein